MAGLSRSAWKLLFFIVAYGLLVIPASAQIFPQGNNGITIPFGGSGRFVVADFNGDRKLDVAFTEANYQDQLGTVMVILGDGKTGFTQAPGSPITAGYTPYGIVAADLNGDGKLDLAVTNYASGALYGKPASISIFLGNGDGSFTPSPSGPIMLSNRDGPFGIVAADFNKDGKLDLVVAYSGSNNVELWLGNGNGGFVSGGLIYAYPQAPYNTSPYDVVAADFNRDGNPDVAVVFMTQVVVFLGDGKGGFSATKPISFASQLGGLTLGDFNHDGKPDLAVVIRSTSYDTVAYAAILLGDGSGGFAQPGTTYALGNDSSQLVVADFDGDGNADLASASLSRGGKTYVLLGNGVGGFIPADGSPFYALNVGTVLAAGDFNNDGAPDLLNGSGYLLINQLPSIQVNPLQLTFNAAVGVNPPPINVKLKSSPGIATYVTNSNPSWLSVTPNSNSAGGLVTMAVNVNVAGLSPGVYAQAIGFDVGRMVEKTATVTLSVVGRSTALSPPILSNIGNGPQGIATGDFNGDGKLDIAVANQNDNTVSVLLGGGGGFSNAPGSPFAAGNQPYAIATGDFNRDGRLDLAITNVGNNTVTVLLGNGFGGFTPAPGSPFATGNWPTSIAAADLDGDGNVDLVIAYAKDNRIAILRGNGSGGFTPLSTAAPCSSFPYVVTVGDFNGDGMQDLAVGCWGHNTNSAVVLLNDGTAKSFAAHPLNIANWVHSLVAKDINGDGQVDLVIGYNTSTGAAATVALGDGQGGFTFSYGAPPTVYAPDATFVSPPGPLMGISVAVGDLNGDGRLDLALADKANPTGLTVLLGDGTGAGFTPATRGGSSVSSAGALAIADFTGDGTNDIAVANAGSPFIAMLSGGWQSTATTLTTTAPASVAANTPVPLTARVVNSGTYVFTPPTGSVSLMDGANLIQSSSSQNGVAGFNPQLVIVGTHSLTAVFQGGSTNLSSTSNAILETVTPGPPAAFTSPNPPQTTTVGTAFALGLKFTVRDVYGNPIPGITVTFSAPTSGASITGFSQTVVTDAQGLAYSPATANTVAGTYQVIASTGSITGQTTLVNTPGATVNFSVSGPTTTPAGSTVAFTVVAQDGYNNPTPNYSANAQISNSDSKATIPRTVQVANGTGSFQGTFYTAKTQIVLVLVQITPPGGGPAIPQASGSANITVTPLTAQSLLVQVPSGASTAGQAIPVAVCALDGYQNFATSYSGTITISTSDPQTSAPTTVTATNGCTATLFITFKTSGNQLVFAKSPTLPLSSSPVSITPGPPVGITVLGGTPQSTIFSTPFSTLLQGRVMDAFGNPVPSTPVTFTAPVSGAGATFLSNPATTDLNGYFSVTAVANSKFGQYEVVASAGAAPALYTLTNGVGLTLQTSPPGLTLVRDAGAGTPVSTPSTFILLPGTTMTVTAPSPWASNTDPANAQYAFQSWSDGGDRSHSFVVPSQNLTLTANYGQQYRLTATSSLPAAGSVTLPAGTTTATGMYGFFDASSTVSIAATANSGYSFSGWVGPAAIQSNAATTVVMTGPQSVTANFRRLLEAQVSPVFLGLQYVKGTDPAAGHVSVRTNDPSPFSVSSGAAWAVPTPSSATSPASVTVGLNPAALAPGDYSTTLTFRFSDGTAIPVYVQLKVLDVPKLIATPAALNFAAQAGATDVQSQNVILAASSRNVAVQAVATGGDWLTASLAQGNTPVTLRIQVDPSKLGAGTYSGSVAVSSPDAGNSPLQIPVTFNISAQPPTNSISGFVNTASMTPGDSSPNTMMTAFGTFPGCGADTQVLIDGTPTEVYGVGAARIDFLMAGRVSAAQSVQVQVQCGGKSTPPVTVGIRQAAPAVFTTSRSGSGQASVVNEDGSTASPSPRGTTVAVYVTGLGLMGAPAPNGLISTLLPVTASLGGAPVKVAFAGASPGQSAAVQQVNLLIPGDAPIGDAVQLELKVGDVSAQLGVTMAVK